MESKLLDIRDCSNERFKQIYQDMLQISLLLQPKWFRPLLLRSSRLKRWFGYNHWSRAWEYPWAIEVAALGQGPWRILDVGGGGSPFAEYLAKEGHDCFVIDPSFNQGVSFVINRDKGVLRNLRSLIFWLLLKCTGINRTWGLPNGSKRHQHTIHYYPYSATDMEFPDNYFNRVFCLSVMEHIPTDLWQRCIAEFERVLKPGGRLIITLDMGTPQANDCQYLRLVDSCSLELLGNPTYEVPIGSEDKQLRHPGHSYETIGLAWQS